MIILAGVQPLIASIARFRGAWRPGGGRALIPLIVRCQVIAELSAVEVWEFFSGM